MQFYYKVDIYINMSHTFSLNHIMVLNGSI